MRNLLLIVGISFSVLSLGCFGSSAESAVEGTLSIDGQPLENVLVRFHPMNDLDNEQAIASGVTDSNGKFLLSRDEGKTMGAAYGRYVVSLAEGPIPDAVQSAEDPLAAQTFMLSLEHRPLPVVYQRHVDSPLKVDVLADKTNYPLEISSRP